MPTSARLKTRRTSQAAYTSGGEQQMCAIGRVDGQSEDGAARRAVDGLAPQIVEEVFEIVKDPERQEGVTFLLAEQNTNMALRYADYGYIPRERAHRDGRRGVRTWRATRTSGSSTSASAAATARASAT